MIKHIRFKNYKSFTDWTELNFKPITILVGPNSVGKSSIIKMISQISKASHPIDLEDMHNPPFGKRRKKSYFNCTFLSFSRSMAEGQYFYEVSPEKFFEDLKNISKNLENNEKQSKERDQLIDYSEKNGYKYLHPLKQNISYFKNIPNQSMITLSFEISTVRDSKSREPEFGLIDKLEIKEYFKSKLKLAQRLDFRIHELLENFIPDYLNLN